MNREGRNQPCPTNSSLTDALVQVRRWLVYAKSYSHHIATIDRAIAILARNPEPQEDDMGTGTNQDGIKDVVSEMPLNGQGGLKIYTDHADGGQPLTLDILRDCYVTTYGNVGEVPQIVVRGGGHEWDFANFKLRVESGWLSDANEVVAIKDAIRSYLSGEQSVQILGEMLDPPVAADIDTVEVPVELLRNWREHLTSRYHVNTSVNDLMQWCDENLPEPEADPGEAEDAEAVEVIERAIGEHFFDSKRGMARGVLAALREWERQQG